VIQVSDALGVSHSTIAKTVAGTILAVAAALGYYGNAIGAVHARQAADQAVQAMPIIQSVGMLADELAARTRAAVQAPVPPEGTPATDAAPPAPALTSSGS